MAAPGEEFGPYRIVRQVGIGGMGVVHEAIETGSGRRVALKVVSPQYGGDPAFRARFRTEARAQAALACPHVVKVFAHGEIDGTPYLASELIPDGDLGEMIDRRGALPPRVAIGLICQVARGLAAAHGLGVIHRDLKPANVLIRMRDGRMSAHLTDFGIARRVDADQGHTAAGFTVGTPQYMAPELHTGAVAGEQSDVYSLGCLLWVTLVGRAPYPAHTDYQVAQAHLAEPIPQLASDGPFEEELNRILRTALAKDRAERHPTVSQLRDDLRRLLAGEVPDEVRAASDLAARRRHSPLGLIAAVAASLLLTGAVVATGVGVRVAADAPSAPTDGLTAREQTVADGIADELAGEADISADQADCVGVEIVERIGVDRMIEAGLIDEDLTLHPTAADDGIERDLVAATRTCV